MINDLNIGLWLMNTRLSETTSTPFSSSTSCWIIDIRADLASPSCILVKWLCISIICCINNIQGSQKNGTKVSSIMNRCGNSYRVCSKICVEVTKLPFT